MLLIFFVRLFDVAYDNLYFFTLFLHVLRFSHLMSAAFRRRGRRPDEVDIIRTK